MKTEIEVWRRRICLVPVSNQNYTMTNHVAMQTAHRWQEWLTKVTSSVIQFT